MTTADHCRTSSFYNTCSQMTGAKLSEWGANSSEWARSLTIAENCLSRGIRNLVDECWRG